MLTTRQNPYICVVDYPFKTPISCFTPESERSKTRRSGKESLKD